MTWTSEHFKQIHDMNRAADLEKKISEIREAKQRADTKFEYITEDYKQADDWIEFLLSELDRVNREYADERSAHNTRATMHIEAETGVKRLEQERERLIEGLQKSKFKIEAGNSGNPYVVSAHKLICSTLKSIGIDV